MTLAVVSLALLLFAAEQAQPPQAPPAPPPGSPGVFKSNDDLLAALKKAVEGASGMTSSAVSNTDQYRINLVRRSKPAGALAHAGNTELHYIVDGAGTIVTGGKIVRSATGAAAAIENGETRRMVKGDVIIVPADTPHWYKDVEGSITYLEVRFVAPK